MLSRRNRVLALRDLQRWDEADPEIGEAVRMRRKVPGEDSPGTVSACDDVADLLEDMGRWDEAEPEIGETIRIRREMPGPVPACDDLADLLDGHRPVGGGPRRSTRRFGGRAPDVRRGASGHAGAPPSPRSAAASRAGRRMEVTASGRRITTPGGARAGRVRRPAAAAARPAS
ncbi:tetratricopeptide repeat protein [Thermopolyspora sp. NPDC052614]|uniref:tetratricopeptide repeat protein n=1 Tax=Thermopolyspora sp. NPDC052614 TaxID=3155682 RepID=UPI0034281F5C